jgi:hypothetical protein
MRNDDVRSYELVTPEEFRQLRGRNFKHHDLYRAIREMRKLSDGEGIKIRLLCSGQEAAKRQKAAVQIARREGVPVRTMLRSGWLFIEKIKKV